MNPIMSYHQYESKPSVGMMSHRCSIENIGLLGPWGYGNLGDAAIQQAMLQHLKRYFPEAKIYGFSLNPQDTLKRHGLQSFPLGKMPGNSDSLLAWLPDRIRYKRWIRVLERVIYRLPLAIVLLIRAFNYLKNFDLLIISGGGQLDDYWGGAWQHPYTLLKWGIVAKIRQTKFMFVSVGAGPLNAGLSRWFIKNALGLTNYRSFRDESSKKFIKEKVGFYRDDPVYPDLAYSLVVTNGEEAGQEKTSRPIVGINPMAYFDPRVWPEKDSTVYQAYLTKLALFVAWLVKKQYAVLFFPGNTSHDQWAIKDLQDMISQMGVTYAPGQLIEPSITTVDELMVQLSRTNMVVATRLHSLLLATIVNKPVLALSYHEKIDMLMQDTGQAKYCLPIGDFEVESLIERFIELEANCTTIKSQLAQKTQEYRAALDQQYEYIFNNF
jgi:polysaccharide pyruvyl transferase WcaK-like protein